MMPAHFFPSFKLPACLLALLAPVTLFAQNQTGSPNQLIPGQSQPSVPTFHVTSTLVYLDVTVLDKKGNPVVSGLSKDDFHITEDKIPQHIFSFDAPKVAEAGTGDYAENPQGRAPITVLVLDEINTSFSEMSYVRQELRKALASGPEQLAAPTELMVSGENGLDLVQSFTQNRDELIEALVHLPAPVPWLSTLPGFQWLMFGRSVDALQEIALQNRGVSGRKNVIWLGRGPGHVFFSPSAPSTLTGWDVRQLKQYAHAATNMLVDSRMTLFVIYPPFGGNTPTLNQEEASQLIGDTDPFSGDISFGLFVNETGGKLYYDLNDIAQLIEKCERLGSQYYTLTYQPARFTKDDFRRIRVTLKNPKLLALTKTGYFGPSGSSAPDPSLQFRINLAEASVATIPFNAIPVSVQSIRRRPDSQWIDIVLNLEDKHLVWEPADNGVSHATLLMAAVGLDDTGAIRTSHIERAQVSPPIRDSSQRERIDSSLPITLRFPRSATHLRVVVEAMDGGRIGSVDLSHKEIEAAPLVPSRAAP